MLNRIRRLFRSAAPADETRALTLDSLQWMALAPTRAGINVGPETAMRSPTAAAAIRAIAETCGQLPCHFYRRGPDGKQRAGDDPRDALVAEWASPWESSQGLRTALVMDALLHGAGYARVVRVNDRPVEIHRLPPSAVTPEWSPGFRAWRYRVRSEDGGEDTLSWTQVIAVRTPGSAPDRPVCLTTLAREPIAVEIRLVEFEAQFLSRGGKPGGVLTIPGSTSVEQIQTIRRIWESTHGADAAGGTAILQDGAKYSPVALSLVDAQFHALREFAVAEIARIYRVPPPIVGDLGRATWGNSEQMGRQFLTLCILPWLEELQAAYTRALIPPQERGEVFFEFTVDDLIRADTQARASAYRTAVGGSYLTPNEARARENLPPVPGGDALVRQAGQTGAVGDGEEIADG